MGDQIKRKMTKKIHMSFDNERIMYSTTDEKTEEEQSNKIYGDKNARQH